MTPEEQKQLLRDKRGAEGNFDELVASLQKAIEHAESVNSPQTDGLKEIMSRQVPKYKAAKENGGTTWPEFEQFVSAWEKLLIKKADHIPD